ncbi:MAG: ACT domain-containing protein [Gemmatimonadaceae bacterium]
MQQLQRLPDVYAVCRLAPNDGIPFWCVQSRSLLSITRTPDELSVVCPADLVPAAIRAERGFCAWRVAGTLDFSLTGVAAALTTPLAEAGISVFVIATFDTDYLLVRETHRERAEALLARSGFSFLG